MVGLGEFGRVGLGEVLNFWFWVAWVFGVGKFLVFLCLGWEVLNFGWVEFGKFLNFRGNLSFFVVRDGGILVCRVIASE